MWGESDALNRQGEMRSTSSNATGRPSAASSTAESLSPHAPGSNPLTIGLMAATAPPAPRICRIKPAVRNVLPISVPVAVMKTAVIALRRRLPERAHGFGQPLDLVVRMLRGKGQPQARGPHRHGRRPDGDDQETMILQEPRRFQRRLGLAEEYGDDGAYRLRQPGAAGKGLGFCEGKSGVAGFAFDHVERRDRSRDDCRRKSG